MRILLFGRSLCVFMIAAFVHFTSATQDLAACESIRDSSRRAACFERVARELAQLKKAENDIEKFVSLAKRRSTRDFNDPDSANFRGLLVTQDKTGRALCGEVNGKNRMGGFVGYRRFVTHVRIPENEVSTATIEEPGGSDSVLDRVKSDLFKMNWDLHCVSFPPIWRE